MSTKHRTKKNKIQNSSLGMLAISFVCVLLLVFFISNSIAITKQLDTYNERVVALNKEIEIEEKRTVEIENLRDYMMTDAYVEEYAREKFRFVRENEILFVEE